MKAIREIALSLALVLVFTVAVSIPSAPAQTEEKYVPHKMMWVAKRSNVRAGPSTIYLKTDLLEVGERVTVVAKIGDWFKLSQRPGQPRRFVYAPLLTESKPGRSTPSSSPTTDSTYKVKTIPYRGGEYQGPTRNSLPHGYGVASWPEGDRYEGDFVDGKRTGRGILTWPNGERYEGDFVDGFFSGRGVYTWPSGARYEGEFFRGKRSGHGVYTWADGERYEGEFVDGKRTGRGVYISADEWNREAGQDVESPQRAPNTEGVQKEPNWEDWEIASQGNQRGWTAIIYGRGDDLRSYSWGAASGKRTEEEARQSAKNACLEESRKRGITGSCYNGAALENSCLIVWEYYMIESISYREITDFSFIFRNTREEAMREIDLEYGNNGKLLFSSCG